MAKITNDAGHGGYDPGAVGNNLREKDFNLFFSNEVGRQLKEHGHKMHYTRTGDYFVGINQRARLANANNSDIFVSYHINSATSKSARGIEVLYKSSEGKKLAQSILNELVKTGLWDSKWNRGVKYRNNLGVLNGTKMPATLIEYGFISNSQDAKLLIEHKQELADATVRGINNYLGVATKKSKQPNPTMGQYKGFRYPMWWNKNKEMVVGNDVKRLQEIIGANADGYFGKETEDKLIAFQSKNNLEADGIVGKSTIDALTKDQNVEVKTYESKELTKDTFIEVIGSVLIDNDTVLLPSITIAQAILESAWGQSELAKNAKNLFGIKASVTWGGKTYAKETAEFKDGKKYNVVADFRAYDSYLDSIKDHDNFFIDDKTQIERGFTRKDNYANVVNTDNYKDQARAFTQSKYPYATDPKYADKLISLIEEHKLYKFDTEEGKQDVSEYAEEAWQWAIDRGITDGSRPNDQATREEVITMIFRTYMQ